MGEMFRWVGSGVRVDISPEERAFLSQVLVLLDDVGVPEDDPAARRLEVPVYLDAPEANEAWWLLMGEELRDARDADREVFRKVVGGGPLTLSDDEADAFLRVLNEGRLAFAARLGLEVEEDHDRLPQPERAALDYLGWVLEALTEEMSRAL